MTPLNKQGRKKKLTLLGCVRSADRYLVTGVSGKPIGTNFSSQEDQQREIFFKG